MPAAAQTNKVYEEQVPCGTPPARVDAEGPKLPFLRHGSSRSVIDAANLSAFSVGPDVIAALYYSDDFVGVQQFLRKHTDLHSTLLRARGELEWIFGPNSRERLTLERDPEEPCDPRLVLRVQTTATAARASELLDSFDDRWWLEVEPGIRARLKVDVEYI
jgi:hypothetical protein